MSDRERAEILKKILKELQEINVDVKAIKEKLKTTT